MNKYIFTDIISGNILRPIGAIRKKLMSSLFKSPYAVMIEPVNFCNLQCPLCSTPPALNPRKKEALSYDNFQRIIDKVKTMVQRVYLVFAGEPLLNTELPKMISYARNQHLFTITFTNATLLNEKVSQEILNAGLDYLIISFDGFSKEVFEDFRRGANFQEVLNNIRTICLLKQNNKRFRTFIEIQWILTKKNQEEVKLAQDFFKTLRGLNRFYIKTLSLNEHYLDADDFEIYKKEYLPTISDGRRLHYADSNKNYYRCIMNIPVILLDGSVTLCCYDFKGDYVFGNILNANNLRELLRTEKYREAIAKARKRNLPLCRRCPSELV